MISRFLLLEVWLADCRRGCLLASPVLSQKSMDLFLSNLKGDLIIGDKSTKDLGAVL
jgi:hypothetical protein